MGVPMAIMRQGRVTIGIITVMGAIGLSFVSGATLSQDTCHHLRFVAPIVIPVAEAAV